MGKMDTKVVLITGGGKGIGFGIATAFAKEGANLVITGRTVSRLEDAKKHLRPTGYRFCRLQRTADMKTK